MKVYVADLYRFGGTISAADTTERKAISAVMKEYRAMYEDWNGGDKPTRGEVSEAKEDIEISEYTLGIAEYR